MARKPHAARVIDLDTRLREAQTALQDRQRARNRMSREIGAAKARGEDASGLIADVAGLRDTVQALDQQARALATRNSTGLLAGLPNLPADDVPDGADECANVEIRRWGEWPRFDGGPKQHFEIGEVLGLMDFERAGQALGRARFVVLSGALARLERALAAFMLDLHTGEFGYTEVAPPLLVRDAAAHGTGQSPEILGRPVPY